MSCEPPWRPARSVGRAAVDPHARSTSDRQAPCGPAGHARSPALTPQTETPDSVRTREPAAFLRPSWVRRVRIPRRTLAEDRLRPVSSRLTIRLVACATAATPMKTSQSNIPSTHRSVRWRTEAERTRQNATGRTRWTEHHFNGITTLARCCQRPRRPAIGTFVFP